MQVSATCEGYTSASWSPHAGLACAQRLLLPCTSPHTATGGLLEMLEVLEGKARAARLQGAPRIELRHARDRALLAVADCHLASERADGVAEDEAGADLALRRELFFVSEGIGVPALAAALARGCADAGQTHDEYIRWLMANPDLIGALRGAVRLTSCAPRAMVRQTEVRVTGSRGERMLGGGAQARATVLGSELEQARRKLKRLKGDVKVMEARVADLEAKDAAARSMVTGTGITVAMEQ